MSEVPLQPRHPCVGALQRAFGRSDTEIGILLPNNQRQHRTLRTSRRMCCPTHCASYCAPCQPLLERHTALAVVEDVLAPEDGLVPRHCAGWLCPGCRVQGGGCSGVGLRGEGAGCRLPGGEFSGVGFMGEGAG